MDNLELSKATIYFVGFLVVTYFGAITASLFKLGKCLWRAGREWEKFEKLQKDMDVAHDRIRELRNEPPRKKWGKK